MGKFTPIFSKDGDTYVVPSTALQFDTAEAAVDGGASAGLASGYGLTATGGTVELQEDGDFPGAFLIAAVGNLRAWIVGGPTLDKLITERNEAVTNLPEPETIDFGAIVTDGLGRLVALPPAFGAPYGEASKDFGTKENPLTAEPRGEGDHTGPDGQ